jgi:hypothetical protein
LVFFGLNCALFFALGSVQTYLKVAPFFILAVDSAASRSLNWSFASAPPLASCTLILLLATLEAKTGCL